MAVGTSRAVFGFLACTATAMGTCDVGLLLGLGLGLRLLVAGIAGAGTAPPHYAFLDDAVDIVSLAHLDKGLMVEEAHAGEGHGDAVFVAGGYHVVVTNRTAGLGNILHAALVGAFDIVAKGEEGV